jgi:CBS domain-containing protein
MAGRRNLLIRGCAVRGIRRISQEEAAPTAQIRVEDVMLREVPLVDSAVSVKEAAAMMRATGCGCLLVTEKGKVCGIVTEQDMVYKVLAEGVRPPRRSVRDIMSKNLVGIEAEAPVEAAVELMKKHRIRHLPVLRGNRLVGLVTISSLVEALAKKCEDIDLLHTLLADLEGAKEPPAELYR